MANVVAPDGADNRVPFPKGVFECAVTPGKVCNPVRCCTRLKRNFGNHARPAEQWRSRARLEIITSGCLPPGKSGFVYVGTDGDARVKVGMTTDLEARARRLRIQIVYAHPVRRQHAKDLETETLRLLGHEVGDGEWTDAAPAVAIDAVKRAADLMRRRAWIDPHLTEDEARALRVRLVADDKERQRLLSTPDHFRTAPRTEGDAFLVAMRISMRVWATPT